MPIVNEAHKLAFFDVPKVASSTVKLAMYEIEHGEPLEHKDPTERVHRIYRTDRGDPATYLKEYADYWRFTVVRDPIKRLLSVYRNRIAHHKDTYRGKLAHARAALLSLPMDPDPDTFFTNLKKYRLQSGSIRSHTRCYVAHLGRDLSAMNAVYRLEELDRLARDLGARTGRPPLVFARTQAGGPKLTLDMISKTSYEALRAYTAEDYALLDGLYAPPEYRQLATT